MGSSSSVAQFAERIDKYQKATGKIGSTAVKINAANAKANAEQALRDATGGTAFLRNAGANVRNGDGRVVGKGGAKLSVSAKITEDVAFLSAVGPWQLIEYPTDQHFIDPAGQAKVILEGPVLGKKRLTSKGGRSGAKARTGRAKALSTPFGPRAHVLTKGTKGKLPWHKGLAKTEAEASQGLKKAADLELGKI